MSITAGMTLHKVLNLDDEAKIDVTASRQKYTLNAANAWISFQNTGTTNVWMGGPNMDADTSRGYKLFPGASFIFEQILEAFVIYFECEGAETGTISLIKG